MKTWKTITTTALITSVVTIGGVFIYTSQQPAHYEGNTFSTSSSSSSTESTKEVTEETTNTEQSTEEVTEETTNTEQSTVEYNTLYLNHGLMGWAEISRTGFYVVTPMQATPNIDVVEITTDGDVLDEVTVHGEGGPSDHSELNCDSAQANAEDFCKWLRQEAPSGHTTNGLQSNYNYWVKNCKYKYKQ